MSDRSILFLLCFSLVLVACLPLQAQPPTGLTAGPTFGISLDIIPTSLPQGASTPPIQPVTANATLAPDYAPRSGDEALARAGVFLDSASLLVQGSSPAQYILSLKGNLPTPCHMLRVKVDPPDATNRIMLEVYSLTDPTKMCAEVLKPFEQDIDLGRFPAGHYTVFVNDRQVGEFDA
jgi:hypothetical protein